VHVDGAFGLWAAASPRLASLVAGADGADSWALDAHKWLNVPYDCGVAIVADGEAHAAAMSATAEYLLASDDGLTKTPEMSRRGRQVPVYAALRHLGRRGITDMVERNCAQAARLAEAMAALDGAEVLNDVVLNQVLLRFDGDDERTARVIEELQAGGEAWLGGTAWHGMTAARVSFSNWSTTDDDVDRLAAALEDALAAARTGSAVR
jgi:glutamate/tyrosine decarboxylase-like PLP-dependent enzyme